MKLKGIPEELIFSGQEVETVETSSSLFEGVAPFDVLMREEYSDVNLVIGANIIGVHQIILASHSPFLANVLMDHDKLAEGGVDENVPKREKSNIFDKICLVIPDFSLGTVTKLVHFLYSGEVISDIQGLKELKDLSVNLKMPFLELKIRELEYQLSPSSSAPNKISKEQIVLGYQIDSDDVDFDILNDSNNIVIGDNAEHHIEDEDINNASFITLSGLEDVGGAEIIVTEEEMIINEDNVLMLSGDSTKFLKKPEADLETPVQSPNNDQTDNIETLNDIENMKDDHSMIPEPHKNFPSEHSNFEALETLDTADISPEHSDYVQCELCNISCTDDEYMKRHLKTKHSIDMFENLDGIAFTCSQCEYSTHSKNILTEHFKESHTKREYVCDFCQAKFVSVSKLDEHSVVHTGEKSFVCLVCGKAFSRACHLKVHNRIHTGERPYKCTECHKTFFDSSALRAHMRSHADDKPYKCGTCGKCFKDKRNLRQHEAIHKADRPHRCEYCGQGFTYKRNMLRHAETHALAPKPLETIFKCDICEATFKTLLNLADHNRVSHPDKPVNAIKCHVTDCGQTFDSHKLLKSHHKKFHQEKLERDKENGPYSCHQCGVKFGNIRTLRKHMKSSHSSNTSFKCGFCNKDFQNECDLNTHMKEGHTNMRKKHSCEYCNKTWDRASDLVKHIRVHTGEKPFLCRICDKKFSDKSLFLRHFRTHKVGESSVFVCGICDKKFQVEANLEKHLKVHTAASYSCSFCSKKFYDEISLAAHINVHNGASKPYACTFCENKFASVSDFRKHERTHTGEKPYKCDHCERHFSDISAMKRHERRHLKVLTNEQFQCFGCDTKFLKEEAFFKHATLFCSGSHKNKKCLGKPKSVPEHFPPSSIVRCLNCKITLPDPETLKTHLDIPDCKGPIYAKVTGSTACENPDVGDSFRVVQVVSQHDCNAEGGPIETLTTVVEMDPSDTLVEDPNDNSVMRMITQLNEMVDAIPVQKVGQLLNQ